VAIADAQDVDDPSVEKLRRVAIAPTRAEQLDTIREGMARDKLAAMRASKTPPRRRDGSKAQTFQDDPTGRALESQRLLTQHSSQAARHAEMAAAGHVGDSFDAHRDTRPIREQMYAGMAKQEMGQQ
jgi:hypothetical protein